MRVHYKGSSTFCCNSNAPCAEHAPAQSDAPSAEEFLISRGYPFGAQQGLVTVMEAYAALRTAKIYADEEQWRKEAQNLLAERAGFVERVRISESALSEARESAQKLEDALEGMFDSYDIITSLASDNPIMRGMIAGAFLGVEQDRALLAGASGAAGNGGAE